MRWARASQPRPIPVSDASMAPSLPPTPVSTRAASPPRTSRYAETNPRFTRSQATASALLPDAGGVDAGGGLAPAEPAGPGEGVGPGPAELGDDALGEGDPMTLGE